MILKTCINIYNKIAASSYNFQLNLTFERGNPYNQ